MLWVLGRGLCGPPCYPFFFFLGVRAAHLCVPHFGACGSGNRLVGAYLSSRITFVVSI